MCVFSFALYIVLANVGVIFNIVREQTNCFLMSLKKKKILEQKLYLINKLGFRNVYFGSLVK